MIKNIRPHSVFTKVNLDFCGNEIMRVVFPCSKTPKLLLTAVLVALAKIVKARAFFEIGTYLGIQTLNIAMNLPSSAKIYTLDFDEESFKKAVQHKHEVLVSLKHFEYKNRLAFLKTRYQKRIKRLYGDSNKFDFSRFEGKMDMIYVDGGHDLRTLKSDTKNAFKMLSRNSLSCIAWHDYNNPNHPHLTRYLNKLSNRYNIYHIEETKICFYLRKGSNSTKSYHFK